jgi:hypothetical protein
MNRAIAARAALYNAESARLLGWTTASVGVYSSPSDPALPYLVSRYQERKGIAADGRITPETLRAMIKTAQVTQYGSDRLIDSLLLGNANPDAGTPQIPPSARGEKPAPAPAPAPAPTPAPAPAPTPAPTSRAPLVVGVLAAAALVWHFTRKRGR